MIIVLVMHHNSLLQDKSFFFKIKFMSSFFLKLNSCHPSPWLYFTAYGVLDIHRRLVIKSKVSKLIKRMSSKKKFLDGTTKW